MGFFKSFVVASGLTALVSGYSPVVPRYLQKNAVSRINITASTVSTELGPQLSSGSLVFGPEDERYTNATERWNLFDTPVVQVVVNPASESDVSKIIKYCNANGIEFLVRNRGHGTTTSLSAFKGLQINMDLLSELIIREDGKSAFFQGGLYGAQVVNQLWEQGFVTTTGSAPCVGLLGPGLGGGHGRYEGLYGLVGDNILHFNAVLADGTEIGVNKTSYPDLYWALKGAGHNFVAVTSIEKEIYPAEWWAQHSYTWTGDKLEAVFEALNTFHKSWNGTTPPKMGVNSGAFIFNTTISKTEAVLSWDFQYAGPPEELEALVAPFNAIPAENEVTSYVTYPVAVGSVAGTCGSSKRAISSTLTLNYNVTAERILYEHYNKKVLQYPELAAGTYAFHEGYASAGYQSIPSESTAYAYREENHILVFFSEIPAGDDAIVDAAEEWALEVRDIWNQGQPDRTPKTYINYAQGYEYETLEAVYGYEPWRLERLRSLKAAYDPENKFRYFVPIIRENQ